MDFSLAGSAHPTLSDNPGANKMGSKVSTSTSAWAKVLFDLSAPPPQCFHLTSQKAVPVLHRGITGARPPFSFLPGSRALCPRTPSDLVSSAPAEFPGRQPPSTRSFTDACVACLFSLVSGKQLDSPACFLVWADFSGFIPSDSPPVFPALLPSSPFKGTGHVHISQRR